MLASPSYSDGCLGSSGKFYTRRILRCSRLKHSRYDSCFGFIITICKTLAEFLEQPSGFFWSNYNKYIIRILTKWIELQNYFFLSRNRCSRLWS
jgi:hypothetical protein